MSEVDLSKLKNDVSEYIRISDKLQDSYKSQWSDSVHTSFQQYVNQIQDYSKEVKNSSENIEEVVKTVNRIEDCIRKTDEIIAEASNL